MTTLVVLFNLKPEASASDYEHWAKTTDLPIVRELSSVDSFDAFKTQGVLGSDNPAPYEYVEVIHACVQILLAVLGMTSSIYLTYLLISDEKRSKPPQKARHLLHMLHSHIHGHISTGN